MKRALTACVWIAIAVGGALALLRATNEVMPLIEKLPMGFRASPALWEIKCIGLLLIFVYAFVDNVV